MLPISVSFSCFFLRFCSILLGAKFFGLPFCLTYIICFYELGETATFPELEGVVLGIIIFCVDCVCLVTWLSGAVSGVGPWGCLCWGLPGGMAIEEVGMGLGGPGTFHSGYSGSTVEDEVGVSLGVPSLSPQRAPW